VEDNAHRAAKPYDAEAAVQRGPGRDDKKNSHPRKNEEDEKDGGKNSEDAHGQRRETSRDVADQGPV
jgi:hypothetical protein